MIKFKPKFNTLKKRREDDSDLNVEAWNFELEDHYEEMTESLIN